MTLNSSGPPRKTSYLVSITLLSRKAQPHYLLRHLEGETEHGAEPASLAISLPSTTDTSPLPSPTLQRSPGDEIDSSIGCAWREELQGEPLVSSILPAAHLVPQPLMSVSIKDRGRAARVVLGALASTAAAAIRPGAGTGTAGMLGLINHGESSGEWSRRSMVGTWVSARSRYCWGGQQMIKEAYTKTQHSSPSRSPFCQLSL